VLIVEDDPDIARTLQIRLQGIGVKVQIAYDADSAGRLAHQGQPDLVLLDDNPLDAIGNSRRVHGTMVRGHWLSRSELDRLLEAAEVNRGR